MREIKFRAKTIDGFWFYWKLTDPINMAEMSDAIDWHTFGQFSGLKDNNENEIYEGDIRRAEYFCNTEKYEHIAVMEWDTNFNAWMWATVKGSWYDWMPIKITGNIYDNPELMCGSQRKDWANLATLCTNPVIDDK